MAGMPARISVSRSFSEPQPGHDGAHVLVRGGVRGVEGPVAAARVLVVVGAPGGLADLRVGVGGIDPGEVGRAGPAPPVLDDHLRGGGAAPGLAAVVVLRVLALVDLLRVARHLQLAREAGRRGVHREPVRDVGGHRAEPPHGRREPAAREAVEGDPQPVGGQAQAGGRGVDREGVGGDGALAVALAVEGGAPDVRCRRRPPSSGP